MMYRVQEGMLAWLFHRVTGVGVALFLFLHIADITLIGWGPGIFNKLLFIYHAPPFKVMEVMLLAAVLYHALNGVRIILVDFWPAGAKHQKKLFYGELGIFVILFAPAAWWMLRSLWNG